MATEKQVRYIMALLAKAGYSTRYMNSEFQTLGAWRVKCEFWRTGNPLVSLRLLAAWLWAALGDEPRRGRFFIARRPNHSDRAATISAATVLSGQTAHFIGNTPVYQSGEFSGHCSVFIATFAAR